MIVGTTQSQESKSDMNIARQYGLRYNYILDHCCLLSQEFALTELAVGAGSVSSYLINQLRISHDKLGHMVKSDSSDLIYRYRVCLKMGPSAHCRVPLCKPISDLDS